MGKKLQPVEELRMWPLLMLNTLDDDLAGNLSFFDHSVLMREFFAISHRTSDEALVENVEHIREQLVTSLQSDIPLSCKYDIRDELDLIDVWLEVFDDSCPEKYGTFVLDLSEAMESYYGVRRDVDVRTRYLLAGGEPYTGGWTKLSTVARPRNGLSRIRVMNAFAGPSSAVGT